MITVAAICAFIGMLLVQAAMPLSGIKDWDDEEKQVARLCGLALMFIVPPFMLMFRGF